MILKVIGFIISMTLVVVPAYALEVSKVENNSNTLLLSGKIVPGDLNKILSAVSPPNKLPKYFTLDSPGGSLIEAMKIGEFIRKTASGTLVTDTCASACVFILVAGVSRIALTSSAIGLHRPYFNPKVYKSLSFKKTHRKYAKVMHSARRYLKKMDVPTTYIDKMFSIASDDVYWLSDKEKKRLLVDPPVFSEWVRARCHPPTTSEWNVFRAKGYNIFGRPRKHRDDPYFVSFMSKLNHFHHCRQKLIKNVREKALKKYLE